jgi:hypothetical protein
MPLNTGCRGFPDTCKPLNAIVIIVPNGYLVLASPIGHLSTSLKPDPTLNSITGSIDILYFFAINAGCFHLINKAPSLPRFLLVPSCQPVIYASSSL